MFDICGLEIFKYFIVFLGFSSFIDFIIYRVQLYLNRKNSYTKCIPFSKKPDSPLKNAYIAKRIVYPDANKKLIIDMIMVSSNVALACIANFIKISVINKCFVAVSLWDIIIAIVILKILSNNEDKEKKKYYKNLF